MQPQQALCEQVPLGESTPLLDGMSIFEEGSSDINNGWSFNDCRMGSMPPSKMNSRCYSHTNRRRGRSYRQPPFEEGSTHPDSNCGLSGILLLTEDDGRHERSRDSHGPAQAELLRFFEMEVILEYSCQRE